MAKKVIEQVEKVSTIEDSFNECHSAASMLLDSVNNHIENLKKSKFSHARFTRFAEVLKLTTKQMLTAK